MSVEGKYSASAETPMGKREFEIEITAEGGKFTGTLKSAERSYKLDEVKVEGNGFSFPVHLYTSMGDIDATYKCTVDGDTLNGDILTSYMNVPLKGQRI